MSLRYFYFNCRLQQHNQSDTPWQCTHLLVAGACKDT